MAGGQSDLFFNTRGKWNACCWEGARVARLRKWSGGGMSTHTTGLYSLDLARISSMCLR